MVIPWPWSQNFPAQVSCSCSQLEQDDILASIRISNELVYIHSKNTA